MSTDQASKPQARDESGTWAALVRGALAGIVVAAFVEVVRRVGVPVRDPRLICLLAVIYGAAADGAAAAVAAGLVTFVYADYFFRSVGPPFAGTSRQAWVLVSFAGAAVVASAMVIALRERARRLEGTAHHKEREQMQEQNAALNQAVLNSLPAHLIVLDRQGRVVSTNAAGPASGSGEEVHRPSLGADYLILASAMPAGIVDGIRDVVRGHQRDFSTEYEWARDGVRQWFLLNASELAGGRGAVISHLDITTRKQAEESLRQRAAELDRLARSLQRTNEELDQFAYITSHDLRAPLRGIANLSSWIEEDMGDRFTPEGHQQMELLRGRVTRMQAMIDGILEYSRIGRVRSEPNRVDVAALLAEVIDLLDVPPSFTISVQSGMPTIIGEKLRLQQVFMNLIANALKHHDKSAGRIDIGWRDAGDKSEFFVKDDGPGIDPRYHDKVFVIFQTLQPRDKVESTGVGLSLVKKIVEDAGGSVSLESAPDAGATFRFTWPKSPRRPEASMTTSPSQESGGTKNAALTGS